MSDRLTCFDPFAPLSGFEDSNTDGPSILNSSEWVEYFSSDGSIISITDDITMDSLFFSKRLNRDGGNRITRGILYQIRFNDLIDDGEYGRVIHGGTRMVLTDLLTTTCYSFVVIALQRRGSDTYVVVMDPTFSEELEAYIAKIALGGEDYRISFDCITQSANSATREQISTEKFRVNKIRNNSAKYISSKLLGTTVVTGNSPNIWIRQDINPDTFDELNIGKSILLRDVAGQLRSIVLKIRSSCTRKSQTYDIATSTPINLTTLQVSDAVTISLASTNGRYEVSGEVIISKNPYDYDSMSNGVEYFKGQIMSLVGNILSVKVVMIPSGASYSASSWYVTTYDPQINIPFVVSDIASDVNPLDIPSYVLETCSSSIRVQINPDVRYVSYVFRYKPVISSIWHELICFEGDNLVNFLLPNTKYEGQLVGIGEKSEKNSDYSDSIIFNTFS